VARRGVVLGQQRPGLLGTPCALTSSAEALKSPGMLVSAFIEPCLPSPADRPPSGPDWIHEIKLDGFRMMVRRDPAGVRLITRNGHDWSGRFPLIAEAAGALRARSFLIDGEAVACDGDGLPSFDRLRYRRGDGAVFLYAFDLIELNGEGTCGGSRWRCARPCLSSYCASPSLACN
jgi:ATP-dependent DNA ligase